MNEWWLSSDESNGYECNAENLEKEFEDLKRYVEKISFTPSDCYIDWGDITELGKSIVVNSFEGDKDFSMNDYGIYEIKDIPCPYGLQEHIPGLTKLSTASIERLIDGLIFLPFEYGQN